MEQIILEHTSDDKLITYAAYSFNVAAAPEYKIQLCKFYSIRKSTEVIADKFSLLFGNIDQCTEFMTNQGFVPLMPMPEDPPILVMTYL